jgi:hypothetical protein
MGGCGVVLCGFGSADDPHVVEDEGNTAAVIP